MDNKINFITQVPSQYCGAMRERYEINEGDWAGGWRGREGTPRHGPTPSGRGVRPDAPAQFGFEVTAL